MSDGNWVALGSLPVMFFDASELIWGPITWYLFISQFQGSQNRRKSSWRLVNSQASVAFSTPWRSSSFRPSLSQWCSSIYPAGSPEWGLGRPHQLSRGQTMETEPLPFFWLISGSLPGASIRPNAIFICHPALQEKDIPRQIIAPCLPE